MNHRHVEASREARLWVTQVIMPLATIAMLVPDIRKAVVAKAKEVKNKVQLKLHN